MFYSVASFESLRVILNGFFSQKQVILFRIKISLESAFALKLKKKKKNGPPRVILYFGGRV